MKNVRRFLFIFFVIAGVGAGTAGCKAKPEPPTTTIEKSDSNGTDQSQANVIGNATIQDYSLRTSFADQAPMFSVFQGGRVLAQGRLPIRSADERVFQYIHHMILSASQRGYFDRYLKQMQRRNLCQEASPTEIDACKRENPTFDEEKCAKRVIQKCQNQEMLAMADAEVNKLAMRFHELAVEDKKDDSVFLKPKFAKKLKRDFIQNIRASRKIDFNQDFCTLVVYLSGNNTLTDPMFPAVDNYDMHITSFGSQHKSNIIETNYGLMASTLNKTGYPVLEEQPAYQGVLRCFTSDRAFTSVKRFLQVIGQENMQLSNGYLLASGNEGREQRAAQLSKYLQNTVQSLQKEQAPEQQPDQQPEQQTE